MKEKIFTVESKSLVGCKVGKIRDYTTTLYVPELIYASLDEILVGSEDSGKIYHEVALIIVHGVVITNLLAQGFF